ncbi:MAG: S9 family peptidase [Acidobacteriota bacterium]|nr:S9 family peptidase [Acidobacteriota bacterium]
MFGDTRTDDYGWIRDKTSPEAIAYLESENAYADAFMKPTEGLQKRLYEEILGHIKQTDTNVPYRKGDYFYYTRTVEGKQYPIFARKKGSLDAPEEITIDVNKLAEGHKFMSVNAYEISDDGNLLAYSIDPTGYREYVMHVKDLRTGQDLSDHAERTDSIVWAADNKTIFYTAANDAKRQYRLYRHTLGDPASNDTLINEEKDEMFDLDVDRTRSGDWILITSDSKTSDEVWTIPASDPMAAPRLVEPRTKDLKYYLGHRGDSFYIRTNDAGINYRIVKAPVSAPQRKNWVEVIPYRKPVYITDLNVFANYLVASEREGGLTQLEVVDLRDGKSHRIAFPEPAYTTGPSQNHVFDTQVFRYTYTSLVTPTSTYDYDMGTRQQALLKRVEVLNYDPSKYISERIYATAKDGVKIPISLVYRKDVKPRSVNPLWLYSYGSYGSSTNPAFSSARLALLDRGFVYAMAHIRGGGEMGKEWHESGRMMTKKNTFTDFIAAAEHLVKEKYTSKDKLVISGGSAGGLLMGAVTNMRPDLFHVVVAYVPFVDVMNTMLDPTLPLTTQEYIEWGNPNEKAAYVYMKSYDPYSNVANKRYPTMLVRTSINDSQVGFWEGSKWVAKLRANKTDTNPLLLKVNMGAGHGGASGRYDGFKDLAFDYAFVLTQMGM